MNYSVNNSELRHNDKLGLEPVELVLSSIGLIGILASSFNIIIFWNLRERDQIYKFYFFSSIADALYMTMISLYVLFSCGIPCENLNGKQLYRHVYMIVLDDYVTSCLAIYTILIELFITIQRYCMFTTNAILQTQRPKIFMAIICLFSLVFYIPVLFLKKIVHLGKNEYKIENTKFGLSAAGRVIPIVLSSIRLFVASFLLLVINIFTLIKFKKYLKKKKAMKKFVDVSSQIEIHATTKNQENKTRKNVTHMVIFVAFTFSFGTIPYAFYYGLSELFKTKNYFIDNILSLIGRVGLRMMIIFKIIIFYNYNKIYKLKFKTIIQKINFKNLKI